jgi:hypothetical protein
MGLLNTKKTFRIEATAKHRNRGRIISAVRADTIAGRTIDVTIITWSTKRVNETSGLMAQLTLAPASTRYAKSATMCGGHVRLRRREEYRSARATAIAATIGQKNRFSGRLSMRTFAGFVSGS